MTKDELIAELISIRDETKSGPKYNGRAADIKRFNSIISYLRMYRVEDSLIDLLYKEHVLGKKDA